MNEELDNSTANEIGRYVETWTRVLTLMRGRSSEDVRRWAQSLLHDRLELTLHEPAAFWVAPALIPAELTAMLNPSMVAQLAGELQAALDQGDSFWDPQSDEQLRQAHQRVNSVLDRFRATQSADVESELLQTDLPRPAALELAVRVVVRHWRHAAVSDPVRGVRFANANTVSFGRVSRVAISSPNGTAHLWSDAFGLNLVVISPQKKQRAALLEATRNAFELNNHRSIAA